MSIQFIKKALNANENNKNVNRALFNQLTALCDNYGLNIDEVINDSGDLICPISEEFKYDPIKVTTGDNQTFTFDKSFFVQWRNSCARKDQPFINPYTGEAFGRYSSEKDDGLRQQITGYLQDKISQLQLTYGNKAQATEVSVEDLRAASHLIRESQTAIRSPYIEQNATSSNNETPEVSADYGFKQ